MTRLKICPSCKEEFNAQSAILCRDCMSKAYRKGYSVDRFYEEITGRPPIRQKIVREEKVKKKTEPIRIKSYCVVCGKPCYEFADRCRNCYKNNLYGTRRN